jgi:hypothetical protein
MNSLYLKIGFIFFCSWIVSCSPHKSSKNVLDKKLIHTVPLEFDSFYIGFNPTSEMYYYKGKIDEKLVLVINGEEIQGIKINGAFKFGNLTFAKNAYGFFYGEPESQYLRINKETFGPYSGVVEVPPQRRDLEMGSISYFESNGNVIFDKTGKHFCFIAQDKFSGWILVKDGKKENLNDFIMSTKRYESIKGGNHFVEHTLNVENIFPEGLNEAYGEVIGLVFKITTTINDGKILPARSEVKILRPSLDPGSNTVKANGSSLRVNGYGPPQFSSGSPKYFAVTYNDRRVARYKHQAQANPIRQLLLSKDGKHYAYLLEKAPGLINPKKSFRVVVDGRAGLEYDFIGSLRFEENGCFYLASKERDIYALQHRLD